MKVTSLHVANLLSFDSFDLQLDEGLTVLVGPNGSGKTNIARVLDLVGKLVDWADERSRSASAIPTPAERVLSSYVQAMHNEPLPGTPIEVRLGIELNVAAERDRIMSFFRGAVLGTLAEETHAGDEARKAQLSSWVMTEIDAEKLTPLFKGTLAFDHPGYEGATWVARYEFEHQGKTYDWNLHNPSSWHSIVLRGSDSDPTEGETKLSEALLGQPSNTSPPPALPSPLPPFQLDAMCLPAGKKLANLVVRLGTGAFNDQHEPFRVVANALGFAASGSLGQQAYGLARALRICVSEGLVVLGEQFRGLGVGGTIPWRAGIYPWELLASPAPPRDPGFLPLRLFELKNGATLEERRTFEAIQQQFEHLAPGRAFDVTFTAARMPVPTTAPIGAGQVAVAGDSNAAGDDGQPGSIITVIGWDKTDNAQRRHERPIQLFGAGTWEALVLAEALVSSPGRLTVLDEPGASLHPTWQSALRQVLRRVEGQVLLVTHSPHLVSMETGDDLGRLLRMSKEAGGSQCARLSRKFDAADYAKITREFALSSDARALLFCRGAVIVSGPTEQGALPIWCAKGKVALEHGTPSDRDVEFYSAPGDSGFQTILSVLHAFGIPWVIVGDGKSFDIQTNWSSHIFRQIEQAGIDVPELKSFTQRVSQGGNAQRVMTKELWDEQLELGAQHGILTLAANWSGSGEAIEDFFERVAPGKLAEAETDVGKRSKIRKGRWVAQETECPTEIDDLYYRIVDTLHRNANGGENPAKGLSQPGGNLPI
jgi:energy-coupling factor transporter ATP-binding protein EcfA2